jgi:uncharacterized membrane protein YfcA
MTLHSVAMLAAASAVAGVVNAVAGGGTLLSFPAAVAFVPGHVELVANATNSVALTPGSVASAFAYRRELRRDRAALRVLLGPALAGGLVGSVVLLCTPPSVFGAIVPFLVLFATGLLLYQNLRRRPAPAGSVEGAPSGAGPLSGAPWVLPESTIVSVVLQFLVGVYGGYFGAGMGIMMLAILDRLGGADIHAMNGVKSILAAAINAIAAVAFVVAGTVDWRAALIMAVGSIAGGALGAAGARRVKPAIVRWGVVAIGLSLSAILAWRRWGAA